MGKANIVALAVLAVVVVAAVGISVSALTSSTEGNLTALVHASDGSVTSLPLDTDTTVAIRTEKGENEITVQNGTVFISAADCENHDCIHQGEIHSSGAQIICLPHELWIEVVSDTTDFGQMDIRLAQGHEGDGSFDSLSR